jgi:sugar lactone lactonase YvrE
MMLLIAVMALTLNERAGLRTKMVANYARGIQIAFGQEAATEQAIWGLTKDPCWRSPLTGENYSFDGIVYNRKILDCIVPGYTDAITVTAMAPGGTKPSSTSIRYNILPPIDSVETEVQPHQVCQDSSGNTYFADPLSHSIYMREAGTAKILVVAGNGTKGFSGDGGSATDAQLNTPRGVFVDSSGSIIIADTANHRIRKVNNLTGDIGTVAGTGAAGFGGDNGPAIAAKLNNAHTICLDSSGNIYVADTENGCIRKIDTLGTITTVAGTGGSNGYGGDGGPAKSAKLDRPKGVAVDSGGNIYIGDTNNHIVRKVSTSGIIITVAGIPKSAGDKGDGGLATNAELRKPGGIFVSSSGNIFISDTDNNKIRLVVKSSGNIFTIAGTGSAGYSGDGGLATDAKLDHPKGVCLDIMEVIIADTMNGCLRRAHLGGTIVTLFSFKSLGLNHAQGIAMDDVGNLFIADTDNHLVRKLDISGEISVVAGTGSAGFSGDHGPAISAKLDKPRGIAVDSMGNVYIADTNNDCIRRVDKSGVIRTVAGIGGIHGYSGDGGLATSARLDKPEAIAVISMAEGNAVNLYIADTNNACIRKVDAAGKITTVAGIGRSPGYSGDGGPATNAKLDKPRGVFADPSNNIYIADSENHRIRKVENSSGVISTIAGIGIAGYSGDGESAVSATLDKPYGVFVDSAGNLFIADKDNHAVRIVSNHDGNIRTLAGTGSPGFNGNCQPAVLANLDHPTATAMCSVRGGGKIYISDKDNNRIRKLRFGNVGELY